MNWEPLSPTTDPMVTAFDSAWQHRWPGCVPLGYCLRNCLAPTWVRFHSLPESRRYPQDCEDRAEVLHRHLTVLHELSGEDDPTLVVVATSFSEQSLPSQDDLDWTLSVGVPDALYWRSFIKEDDEPKEFGVWWFHLFLSQIRLKADELENLLIRVRMRPLSNTP